jgi:predicted metal-dependent hydrolase
MDTVSDIGQATLPTPAYTVRESGRARHVRFTISLADGLVVVVPRGFDASRIPALLETKRRWLERAAARIEEQRRHLAAEPPDKLPERLSLRGIGEQWSIEYASSGRVAMIEQPGLEAQLSLDAAVDPDGLLRPGILVVEGHADDPARRAALRRWLATKTHRHLAPRLEALADELGFSVGPVSVRSQRTRWGSCSRRGAISLNLKLLFLPEDLVRSVLIHELCHTVHLDHSRRFWTLVSRHDPDFADANKRLRAAWKFVPAWLEAGAG